MGALLKKFVLWPVESPSKFNLFIYLLTDLFIYLLVWLIKHKGEM